jgi:hypothetical protein
MAYHKIDEIDAPKGTEFKISSVTKLKAITDLQKYFLLLIKEKILEY